MIVCGEDEVDEKDGDEGEDHAGDKNLYGEGAGKLWAVAEDGVGIVGTRDGKHRVSELLDIFQYSFFVGSTNTVPARQKVDSPNGPNGYDANKPEEGLSLPSEETIPLSISPSILTIDNVLDLCRQIPREDTHLSVESSAATPSANTPSAQNHISWRFITKKRDVILDV